MDREKPILSLMALQEAFKKADTVTLSKFEFQAVMEIIEPAMRTETETSSKSRNACMESLRASI